MPGSIRLCSFALHNDELLSPLDDLLRLRTQTALSLLVPSALDSPPPPPPPHSSVSSVSSVSSSSDVWSSLVASLRRVVVTLDDVSVWVRTRWERGGGAQKTRATTESGHSATHRVEDECLFSLRTEDLSPLESESGVLSSVHAPYSPGLLSLFRFRGLYLLLLKEFEHDDLSSVLAFLDRSEGSSAFCCCCCPPRWTCCTVVCTCCRCCGHCSCRCGRSCVESHARSASRRIDTLCQLLAIGCGYTSVEALREHVVSSSIVVDESQRLDVVPTLFPQPPQPSLRSPPPPHIDGMALRSPWEETNGVGVYGELGEEELDHQGSDIESIGDLQPISCIRKAGSSSIEGISHRSLAPESSSVHSPQWTRKRVPRKKELDVESRQSASSLSLLFSSDSNRTEPDRLDVPWGMGVRHCDLVVRFPSFRTSFTFSSPFSYNSPISEDMQLMVDEVDVDVCPFLVDAGPLYGTGMTLFFRLLTSLQSVGKSIACSDSHVWKLMVVLFGASWNLIGSECTGVRALEFLRNASVLERRGIWEMGENPLFLLGRRLKSPSVAVREQIILRNTCTGDKLQFGVPFDVLFISRSKNLKVMDMSSFSDEDFPPTDLASAGDLPSGMDPSLSRDDGSLWSPTGSGPCNKTLIVWEPSCCPGCSSPAHCCSGCGCPYFWCGICTCCFCCTPCGSRPSHLPMLSEKQLLSHPEKTRTLLVHFHGGGFVAMSPYSHEHYLRQWLEIVDEIDIVSVNYHKSPEAKYPVALNECYATYRWVVDLIQSPFSPYRQFALIGDSAGGNLVLGCAQRAREDRLLSPIALLLLYPVCSLIPRVSPSLALSFMDPMLHIKVLESCFDVYLENPFQCLDPLVSPAHIPDHVLRDLPPICLVVGSTDPLFDDGILFAERAHAAGAHCDVIVYDGLAHGFASAGTLSREAHFATAQPLVWLKEKFLQRSNHRQQEKSGYREIDAFNAIIPTSSLSGSHRDRFVSKSNSAYGTV